VSALGEKSAVKRTPHWTDAGAVAFARFAMSIMMAADAVLAPSILTDFSGNASDATLLSSMTYATVAALALPFAQLSDRLGRSFVFVMGCLIFILGQLGIGFAPNFETFLFMRVVQGIGAAAQMITVLSILTELYPASSWGRVLGLNTAFMYMGTLLGPYLAGLLSEHAGWRMVYFVGAGISTLSALCAASRFGFRPQKRDRTVGFDGIGTVLVILSMAGLVHGGAHWAEAWGRGLLAFGAVMLVVYVIWEKRARFAQTDISLFVENRVFRYGCAVQVLDNVAGFATTMLLSFYLQFVLLRSAPDTGMILMIMPLLMATLSPVYGRLADRFDPRCVSACGMLGVCLGLVGGICIPWISSLWLVVGMAACVGAGTACFNTANMKLIFRSVPPEKNGMAAGMVGGLRILGMVGSLLLAGMSMVTFMGGQEVSTETAHELVTSMQVSFCAFTVLGLFAVFLTLRAKPRSGKTAQ